MTLPIGSLKPFPGNHKRTITDSEGSTWLYCASFEETTSLYPNALVSRVAKPAYKHIASAETNPRGICYDGTYIWVLTNASYIVTKYDSDGVAQGVSWSVASETTAVSAIGWTGTYFWVAADTGTIYQYDSSGVYTSVSVTLQSGDPFDMFYDGTYLWILDDSGIIYKHDPDTGVYQSESINLNGILALSTIWSVALSPEGTLWVTNSAVSTWELDYINSKVIRRISTKFNALIDRYAACFVGTDFVYVDDYNDSIGFHKTVEAVGLGIYAERDGFPLYMKVA